MPIFDDQSARRIARSVLYTEGRRRSNPAGRTRPVTFDAAVFLFRAVGEIDSGAIGSGNLVTIDPETGVLTETDESFTNIKNLDSAPAIQDRAYFVAMYVGGGLIAIPVPFELWSSSSGSISVGCIDAIGGIQLNEIPIIDDPLDAEFVLAIDTNGCLVRLPTAVCPPLGSGS